ncbi:MAG: N-acetylmuramoyl-L-alanine amidase [Gemmatimonadetes bacterium]|nr:N-acetylmuramoyl-L-alanine amidase [Gemmatimonadota bacterium]
MLEPASDGFRAEFPEVDGRLAPRIVYPPRNYLMPARDSTFLLGSVGSGRAQLTINGAPVSVNPNGSFLAWLPVPSREAPRYELVVTRGADSARLVHDIRFPQPRPADAPPPRLPPDPPRFIELLNANVDAKSDTDAVAILRPTAAGTYKWFLFPGTVLEATGARGAFVRVRLDDQLEAWVDSAMVRAETRAANLGQRTDIPRKTAGNARVIRGARWSDLRIPVGDKPAYLVEQAPNALILTLYGTASNLDIINLATLDPTVRDVTWEQVTSDRLRVTVHLRQGLNGYLTLWDRGTFVLRVRDKPVVNHARPLEGRVIAVDAGHPPIGSTGPTGFYEGEATLAIANALKPMLEAAGATVVMTRTTLAAVALGDRPIMARRADADALVSIHLNAHPDGVNPYRTNGTGTYYFHLQSEPLARAIQRGMVRWMGLRDLGINYDNLALVRPTWMPAILAEGAFVILPDQEAALRTPQFQSRYAIGILEGLEEYFRSLAPGVP